MLESVLCRVYLPEKVTDPISLVFHLDIEQYRIFESASLWRFSIEGEENPVPGHRTTVSAKNVFRVNLTATYWYSEVVEAILIAEPVDLKRERFWLRDTSAESVQTHGTYWLTPNWLSPNVSFHAAGNIINDTSVSTKASQLRLFETSRTFSIFTETMICFRYGFFTPREKS